jgi:hypothetical protein
MARRRQKQKSRVSNSRAKIVDPEAFVWCEWSTLLRSETMAPLPASLKPIHPYLNKAEEMKTADPVVSYYCAPTSYDIAD